VREVAGGDDAPDAVEVHPRVVVRVAGGVFVIADAAVALDTPARGQRYAPEIN
jgi:hypothetical protein